VIRYGDRAIFQFFFVLFQIFLAVYLKPVRKAAEPKNYSVNTKPIYRSLKLKKEAFLKKRIIFVNFDIFSRINGYHMLIASIGIFKIKIMPEIH
jgi:hypothetical protein